MIKTLTREELIRDIESLSAEEVSVVGRLIQLLTHRAPARDAAHEPKGLGGRWKGAFPEDFDVEKAIAELRRAEQDHLDEEAAS